MRQIDHLVYCVSNLERSMNDFEKLTGVRPVFGGYHATQGTKNALVGLGNKCYLELLAIDHQNEDILPPRWMGIDLLGESKFTRWALHAENLEKDADTVKNYNPVLSKVTGGQRKTAAGELLKWQLSLPAASPEVEVVPFFIDWSRSAAHPADSLGRECGLLGIELKHPRPDIIGPVFEQLGLEVDLFEAAEASIRVTLNTPKGVITL